MSTTARSETQKMRRAILALRRVAKHYAEHSDPAYQRAMKLAATALKARGVAPGVEGGGNG